ncbi:cupin domain-containing protein [Cyanobium sp. Morenito 9A2]|uniref:cupin domain-containing protein n=1 Tax=Cyanobium sp. Morenito 9A2 TaxID=2823718 RepID=UPI0020CC6C86|nr:cupin domain-containing protein [Cyanobium sp. Morenito 9A2]MCP9849249.1 cupin domain-containing protein [Cyanobium sp. Morenito 9A2]
MGSLGQRLLGLGIGAATFCCLGWGPVQADGEPAPQTSAGVKVETLVRTSRSWNGATLPAYGTGQPQVTILRITIPAGMRLPLHHHPVINAGVLLEGRLRVVATSGAVLELHAGDPIVEMVNTAHYGENPGSVPATIVVIYAGVDGQAVTVLEKAGGTTAKPCAPAGCAR